MAHCFVGLPKGKSGKVQKTSLYSKSKSGKMSPVRQVLWGDWLTLDAEDQADPTPDGYRRVIWGATSTSPQILYIKEAHTSDERPLEIIFVDVGQGDGAVLVTTDRYENEAVIVVDAGENANMVEFLRRRFKNYKSAFDFHAAIITHPDKDHYLGFKDIFLDHNYGFDVVYQNGLIERAQGKNEEKLGGLTTDPASGVQYIHELAIDNADIEDNFSDANTFGSTQYPPVMHAALNNPRINKFAMLSSEHGERENGKTWMPGFAPSERHGCNIEVLGPVVETSSTGRHGLRKLGKYSVTKNGHSVILQVSIGGFKVLMGGDLNKAAEKFLMAHYGGKEDKKFPTGRSEKAVAARKKITDEAGKRFRSHIMKACHHGASDVTDDFMRMVEPAAVVISSGDEETHVHPRPDLLGRLGKAGRGSSPVLLSTELQRSVNTKKSRVLAEKIIQDLGSQSGALSGDLLSKIAADIYELAGTDITVYGSIYLKTDGQTLLCAFKKETKSLKRKWFTFQYELRDGENYDLHSVFY